MSLFDSQCLKNLTKQGVTMSTRLEHQGIKLFDYHRDSGFTISDTAKQIAKLMEEVGEFVEAIMNGDTDEATMEAGDVAWMLVDILHVAKSKYLLATGMGIALDKLIKRHGPIPYKEE